MDNLTLIDIMGIAGETIEFRKYEEIFTESFKLSKNAQNDVYYASRMLNVDCDTAVEIVLRIGTEILFKEVHK